MSPRNIGLGNAPAQRVADGIDQPRRRGSYPSVTLGNKQCLFGSTVTPERIAARNHSGVGNGHLRVVTAQEQVRTRKTPFVEDRGFVHPGT